ncbi:hypothetical protein GXW74_13600 [Roseomonas eburnea]|uniref:Transmembrane protein n=1 Tax=Neoroseomonas eburnea TaxID=1346889 RepID=A0A9X9XCT9_9PROT|nr:hypothetical protein [Neoroseomonas eburnea]MBR0681525.1 hypothetical protein [Neoroseomonas eburnea]
MIRRLHPIAGMTALLCILGFWTATALSELTGSAEAIRTAKTAILWGMVVLVPAMAMAGGTGFRLGGKAAQPRIAAKRRRMPLIAANGLLILLPSAIFLQARAAAGDFGTGFLVVQAIELAAGALNITLMGLMVRDGLALSGRLARRRAA